MQSGKLALALCAMAFLCGCHETASPPEQKTEVRYFSVVEEPLPLTSSLPGRVSALVVSEVRPQVDGIISKRLFEEGSNVQQGQILYQIDPALYEAAYHTAKAALAEAQASVASLALLEKRYRALIRTKSISQQDLDNAISSHRQARARVDKAKAELETAAINLAYTQIKAPVSGRIGASSVTPGALVTANQSQALAMIQQIDRVYVDVNQSSVDAIRLRRNLARGTVSSSKDIKVRLTLEDGSPYTPVGDSHDEAPQWIEGDLLFSEILVGETTGSVTLRALFSNPDGLLLPGMYVTAMFVEGIQQRAVTIPQGCVLSSGEGRHFVFALEKTPSEHEEFRVVRRFIETERSIGTRWLVKKGLSAGDMVVLEGLQKIMSGELVNAVPVSRTDVSPETAHPSSNVQAAMR